MHCRDAGTHGPRHCMPRPYRMLGVLVTLVLGACSGGAQTTSLGGNTPPVANAGPDQVVFEGITVNLSGAASDADGDPLSYQWTQTGGPSVSVSGDTSRAASFVAPDVAAFTPQNLTFDFEVNDGQATSANSIIVIVEENVPPTANAGPDQTVGSAATVQLDGSGSSDPNLGGPLAYRWTQLSGPAVALSDSTAERPTFAAPVVTGAPITLEFALEVDDGPFSDTDNVLIIISGAAGTATVSGRVNYQFVPPNANCAGLNFAGTISRPIRHATLQLLDSATGTVLASGMSNDAGEYTLVGLETNRNVRLRVRAELKQAGAPGWDVEVRDNTGSTTQALPSRPLYVMDGPEFNTGLTGATHNLTARTGWSASGYTANRAAAPFAILDAIYSGMRLVLAQDPGVAFPALDVFWSVNNTPVDGLIEDGEIGTSFYTSNPDGGAPNPSLFLLGDAANDTEEFDDHVVVHEWSHYFEDNFSRSDSIGGPHSLGDALDARLAFGEGFATALAAMALGEPLYCDTQEPGTPAGFGIDAENGGFGPQGWFNEISVVTLLYDLWDDDVDETDTGSLGFAPIYETLVGPQTSTPAFTTIFSFAAELKPMLAAPGQTLLDSQLARENIEAAGIDIWADNETNDAGNRDVLPVYTPVLADGSATHICTNSDFDGAERSGNKLAEHRYLQLNVPAGGSYQVVVQTTTPTPPTSDPNDRDQSDPDIYIHQDGLIVAWGNSGASNLESFETQSALQLNVDYAVYLEEWRFSDEQGTPPSFPQQVCYDVSFTAAP